ncbi:helix-turn-helix domain-containing protein [uncultured Roseovarius sp.]|uniref:helix-turn-helix domain-containing protein n=1 Tax=uncultured Roseovarius sp. TaxID=293344 RepID=UPI002609EDE8|nr:helix-turn-helix domain-containing protein [uncultured Roseovarius sp.]
MPVRPDDSLDADVIPLAREGVPASDIARRLGVTPNRIHAVLARLRRQGAEFPPVRLGAPCRKQGARLTRLNSDLREGLEPHAIARGMSVKEMALRLLDIVIRDGLVDAILDDTGDQNDRP